MSDKKIYKAAMYLRLSHGDEDLNSSDKIQSNSISSQKMIIENYINAHDNIECVDCFIDDGHTGLNYDRDAFKQMMKKVDDGLIDCIIVKDNSRLGRERIATTEYISKTFEEKGVRYISVNDNYDSLTADISQKSMIMPISNLFNDNYSKDISNKVKAAKVAKWNNGDFMGAFAPYGYQKDPENKNHLVVDSDAAEVVKEIFAKKIAGMSGNAIANHLTESGVLTPGDYKKSKGLKYQSGFKIKAQSKWSCKVVLGILKDEVYIGNLVQGKRRKVNYKLKKEVKVPKSEQVRVENTHEAIISQEDFALVQVLLCRDVVTKTTDFNVYGGLLYCGDCGFSMVRRKNFHKGLDYVRYICSNYNRNGSGACSRHSISEPTITGIVIEELQNLFEKVDNTNRLIELVKEKNVSTSEVVYHNKEYQRLMEEKKKYETLQKTLYQDLDAGIIDQKQFDDYRKKYSNRVRKLEFAIDKKQRLIEHVYEKGIQGAQQLRALKNLKRENITRLLLISFIDKILVYDVYTVEIHFKISDQLEAMKDLREVL